MYKRLIILILCLPLVLMISLFSISHTVSIGINVPVSKIEILGEKFVYLDYDTKEKYMVDYAIYPTNAKNKNVYFKTEQVGQSPLAELEYIDGYIVPKSCGKAKVYLTTVDGSYGDSFIVQVDSNALQSISCKLEKSTIYVSETSKIITSFIPEDTKHTILSYEANNDNVSVSPDGVVTAIAKGSSTITIRSEKYSDVYDTVTIEVKNDGIIDFQNELVTWQRDGSLTISLDSDEICNFECFAYDENNNPLNSSVVDINIDIAHILDDRIALNYSFVDKNFIGSINVLVKATTESGFIFEKSAKIICVNQITAKFTNEQIKSLKIGSESIEMFKITPANANVSIDVITSNDNIFVELKNKIPQITAKKLGVTTLTLKIYYKDNLTEFITITKDIVVTTDDLMIEQSIKTYGIENLFAFAKTEVDGTLSNLQLSCIGGEFGECFYENLTFVSSSADAQIDNTGKVTLVGDNGNELVEFKAIFNYKGISFESTPFMVKCIYDGVNVRNYIDLWTATNKNKPKPIVLHNDIKEDFAVGVSSYYKEILTTYDKTYYENTNSLNDAKIKILIEFKNDVYGNGHTINAHNVAWSKNVQNSTTNADFFGPKNFVAMSKSGGMLSVKAQDNVCFAVYENVTLTNINLKGCDLIADKNNNYDLTDLTYTGTTVEIFGDNVNIQYSRISNGRNVLRAFGDIEDSTKSIHVNIKNSILSSAREFLLRLGTNCFVDGTTENPSPTLPNDNIATFPVQKTYEKMTGNEKTNYENSFIKTFVNVKNSVFKDVGIFAVGLDSHFAGSALEDGSLISDWRNLAKTSYGVKLSFEDDVKMYCWTDLKKVDSSTLIENSSTLLPDISFDVNEMVEKISSNPKFSNIIYQDEMTGTKYVHAGIAFFGGGKNYSVFEDKNCTLSDETSYNTYSLNGYEIKLSDVDREKLQLAAGSESFYFMLNDATTQHFLPKQQEQILNSENAYSCIYKK